MAGRIVETQRPRTRKTYDHKPLVILAGVLAIIALLLFASHRYYSLAKTIDGSLWGEYGDFVGGVVGTIIAYISIRLLVDTLAAQKRANQIARETAKDNEYTYRLQQLNDHFQMLIQLYRETLRQFKDPKKDDDTNGQTYLHDKMLEMRTKMGNCNTTYSERNISAVALYSDFYTNHRDVASVYFRIVYRLLELVFDTQLRLRDKLRYVKILRCQFSEAELFFIRYNAMTSNGDKMKKYLNQFNVTKHLPELSLLEFTYWRDNLFKDDDMSRNMLVTYFIALRKSISHRLAYEEDDELEQIGGRYKLCDELSEDKKEYVFIVKRTPDPLSQTNTLPSVFDKLSQYELRDMIDDFFNELIIYRSIQSYQKQDEVTITKTERVENGAEIVELTIESSHPLILYKNVDPYIIEDKDDEQAEPDYADETFEDSL